VQTTFILLWASTSFKGGERSTQAVIIIIARSYSTASTKNPAVLNNLVAKTDRQTDRQAGRQTGRQAVGQTRKQTYSVQCQP